jgi:hypothetical protein
VKPPARNSAICAAPTSSGLASVVTSASSANPKHASISRSTETRSAAGSSVGVPPPKNTVSTGPAAGPPSVREASRTSARAQAANPARSAAPTT